MPSEAERITTEWRLAEFVRSVDRGRVYTSVPVAGAGLGWGPDAPTHVADAVWIDSSRPAEVVAWDDSLHSEFQTGIRDNPAALLSPRGYADRTAFGMLIVCRELLSRAYPEHQRLSAVALADKLRWMSLCYLSEGIQVCQPDGAPLRGYSKRRSISDRERAAPSGEDLLVRRYYEEVLDERGTLWQEVPVTSSRLDGLHLPEREGGLSWWPGLPRAELRDALRAFDAEVIEAKSQINTDVIGQAIAGAILLAHEFPDHRLIRQTVVVGGDPDPCLEWVCHKRGIRTVRFS